MSNMRRLAVSVLGTVLLAAPLIGSQNMNVPGKSNRYEAAGDPRTGVAAPPRFRRFAATGPCFSGCAGRTGSFPLPGLSVWRETAGSCKTGGPGRV